RKKNLIEFRYVNGSHCGFGSMVKLTSGLRALATVSHVWDAVKEVGYVQGRKGRVPTSNFRELYRHNDGDMVLLSTPDNRVDWASSIGVKACTMVPITDVHLGPHRMDFMNLEGKWFSQPCKIMGIDSFMLRTMCNTEPGYSGLPIYNPKGKIVALHSGAGPSKIENRASILLSITGLTSPRTLSGFESAYEDKHIVRLSDSFQEEDFEVANVKIPGQTISIRMGSANQQMTKPFSFKGKSWAMYEDEDELDYSTVDLSWTRENSGVDLEAENKALKAEVARLKTALAIQEKMARNLNEVPQIQLGKQMDKTSALPATLPLASEEKERKRRESNAKRNAAKRLRKKTLKAELKAANPQIQKEAAPLPEKPLPVPKKEKAEKVPVNITKSVMEQVASTLDINKIEKEVIRILTERKPLARPGLNNNSRNSTTSWRPVKGASKTASPQRASDGPAAARPGSTLPLKKMHSQNGGKLELRPQTGLDAKSRALAGLAMAPRRS
ncbi:hypothetical protein, partial [Arracacha latent virus E]